jgi:hypothetical protein
MTHDVIDCTYNTLSCTVLLGGVWAREANMYAMRGGEGVEFVVVELTTFVTLYRRKRQINLCMGESVKRGKHGVGIGFLAERNCPQKVSKIIKND